MVHIGQGIDSTAAGLDIKLLFAKVWGLGSIAFVGFGV